MRIYFFMFWPFLYFSFNGILIKKKTSYREKKKTREENRKQARGTDIDKQLPIFVLSLKTLFTLKIINEQKKEEEINIYLSPL